MEQITREEHALSVLNALRCQHAATRSQLAALCSLSRPTVTGILDDLTAQGVVHVLDSTSDGGRPAQQYGFRPDPGYVLGIDLAGTDVTITAATLDGRIIEARRASLPVGPREARFDRLVTIIQRAISASRSLGSLTAIGVGTTGIVNDQGVVLRSDRVPEWVEFPLAERLSKALSCPVTVENDINAAAFGEFVYRTLRREIETTDDMLYVTVKYGFHTGLILGGTLHRGHSWNAGEIGDVLSWPQLSNLRHGLDAWLDQAVTAIGPLVVIVDPRLVVVSGPRGINSSEIAELQSTLNRIRPPQAPKLRLDAATLGDADTTIGALAIALTTADQHLVGASTPSPTALTGVEIVHRELMKGATVVPTISSNDELKIGIVGVGARASLALKAEDSPFRARITAVCDPHRLVAERVRDRLHREPEYVSITSTVKDLVATGIDVAFVTSPDDTHADVTCELLEGGVAVYLEKPLAIHLDDATRILETAKRTDSKLYVGHNMRHMQVVRMMRQLILDGRIGDVKAIWCRHFVGSGGDFYFKDWHATREHGNGLLLQKAAHDIDVMHWLAGSHTTHIVGMGDLMVYDKITDKADHSDELMPQWHSLDNWPPLSQKGMNPVIDVEDLSMVLMRMESGVLASYEQCHFTPDYWRNYTVIGTEGRIENFGDGEGGVIKLWNKRTYYNADGDEQFPILGDANGHDDADQLIVNEALRFFTEGSATDTNPLGAWYSVATGIQATDSLRDGSTPREVPQLPSDLIDYFINNQEPRK